MKSPICSSKAAVPITATKNILAPKLAVATTAYNTSDKRAINKSNAPEKSSDQQVITKKKQAAAQES